MHRLSFDFITQVQKKLQEEHVSKREFAGRLNVTPGRVSQIFNDPGNITLESAVEYARRARMKVALVAYDDNDPENNKGPINSEVFYRCWQIQGAPHDFVELSTVSNKQMVFRFPSYAHTSATKELSDLFYPFMAKPEHIAGTDSMGTVQ